MDPHITDREPTITDIKKRIDQLNKDIIKYDTAYKNQIRKNDPNFVTVYHNNGTVSCNKYCHGAGGRSWWGELPIEWKGAQCVVAGKNRNIPCSKAKKDPAEPTGNLQCVCQRNDDFPYETHPTPWTKPDVTPPTAPELNTTSELSKMRTSIDQQIRDIKILIQNVSPKVVENNTLKDTNTTTLLAKLAQAQTTYADLVEEIKIPDYFNASNEAANIKTNSNYNHYVLYLIFTILFIIGLLFVLKNPEAGNLDTMMLVLGLGILLYHGYEYYMMKQRTK